MLKARMQLLSSCADLYDTLPTISAEKLKDLMEEVGRGVNLTNLPSGFTMRLLPALVRHAALTSCKDVEAWVQMVRPVCAEGARPVMGHKVFASKETRNCKGRRLDIALGA